MAQRYKQGFNYAGATRFTETPLSMVEFSSMTVDPTWYVPFNAGDIVPVFYEEVLPHSTYKFDLDYVIRQLSASVRPTMGHMICDIFAFYCPNRVVNESWRNVTGENTSGIWSAPQIELAPLSVRTSGSTKIPVDSIGDLLGFPTQSSIPNTLFSQMNDLKARIYLECYNQYFRDQNYQPPINYSKLNVYQGFLEPVGSSISFNSNGLQPYGITTSDVADGSYYKGAVVKALLGEGGNPSQDSTFHMVRLTDFSLLGKPLKANKLHDAFTSVLPSPQKGSEVIFSVGSVAPVTLDVEEGILKAFPSGQALQLRPSSALSSANGGAHTLNVDYEGTITTSPASDSEMGSVYFNGTNITATADLTEATGVTVNELRTAVATQQVLELLARGGSRYWSFLKSFFGVEADNPFPDIPTQIGHIRRTMDLYQVAQTSATTETPDGYSNPGSLSAFGYSTKGGSMFTKTFLEHGYIMCFAVIRQRNVYSSYLSPDNFRRKTLDFYLPQLANIGEQPIRLSTLNPFYMDSHEKVLGYQEAWYEYRYSPDRILGSLRSGVANSLDVWHFGDDFDMNFNVVDGNWLKSNAQEVLDRTLYVTSEQAPQFIGQFNWKITKQLPMPVYSVPGLDTI